jgi:hypothetical protein
MPSVADLVEPDVLRQRAGDYLSRAGEFLRGEGGVTLVEFGPGRVTGDVDDASAGGRQHVELAVSGQSVAVRCDCPAGAEGL